MVEKTKYWKAEPADNELVVIATCGTDIIEFYRITDDRVETNSLGKGITMDTLISISKGKFLQVKSKVNLMNEYADLLFQD